MTGQLAGSVMTGTGHHQPEPSPTWSSAVAPLVTLIAHLARPTAEAAAACRPAVTDPAGPRQALLASEAPVVKDLIG